MRVIQVSASGPDFVIPLFYCAENSATQVVFDLSSIQNQFGVGVATALFLQPGYTDPYNIPLEQDGATATWTVQERDLLHNGSGKVQIIWTVGGLVAKTRIFETVTLDALSVGGTPPEPERPWYDAALQAAADAEQAAERAEQAAESVLPPLIGSYTDIPPSKVKEALMGGRVCVISYFTTFICCNWFFASNKLYGVGFIASNNLDHSIGLNNTLLRTYTLKEKDEEDAWQMSSGVITGVPPAGVGDTIQYLNKSGKKGWYASPGLPTLTSADAGKLVSVNDAGDGFSLAEAQKGMDPLIGSYEDITPAQVKDAISAGRSCFVEIPSLGTIGSWTTAMGKVYGSGIQIGTDGTSFGGFGISEDNSGNWEFRLLTGELLPNTASLAWGYLFYDGKGTWSTRQDVVRLEAKELFAGAMPRWDGTSWKAVPSLPVPTAADAGKTIRVNAAGDGYEFA